MNVDEAIAVLVMRGYLVLTPDECRELQHAEAKLVSLGQAVREMTMRDRHVVRVITQNHGEGTVIEYPSATPTQGDPATP